MLVAVKNVQENQIIVDASGRQIIVSERIEVMLDHKVRSVILNGLVILDSSPWSAHFSNPDEEIEVVLSESN